MLRAIARVLTHPVVAGAALHASTLAVWHSTPFYELMMRSHDVHIATHLMFIVAAMIMWWPVMSPVPELPPLGLGPGMLYLFLVGIPMQLVAAMITLADEVLYPWYAAAPRTWGLSPLDDQKLGGLLMWVPATSTCSPPSAWCSSSGRPRKGSGRVAVGFAAAYVADALCKALTRLEGPRGAA